LPADKNTFPERCRLLYDIETRMITARPVSPSWRKSVPLRYLEFQRLDRVYEDERDMLEFHASLAALLDNIPIETARVRIRTAAEAAIAAALVDAEAQI
jgi:hypothetical protein